LDTQAVQFSDFNPIHTQVKRTYKSRISEFQAEPIEASKSWEEMTVNIDAEVYNFEFSEDFYVTVALEKEALVDLDDNTEVSLNDLVEEVEHNEMTKQDDYHIISGCFSVVDNANNLVSDLNLSGFKAQILDNKGGLNRVSAGGFSTRGEAKSALEKVKSNGFSGWILKY
jgi:cell division protein FtsN